MDTLIVAKNFFSPIQPSPVQKLRISNYSTLKYVLYKDKQTAYTNIRKLARRLLHDSFINRLRTI